MAMKRPAGSKKNVVASKCKEIAEAIQETEAPQVVIDMLSGSVKDTVGQLKASRHALNERFVGMIEEVFVAHKESLEKDMAAKEAALAELTPAKATRESDLESAKAVLAEKSEAFEKAKEAFSSAKAELKEATSAAAAKKKEQEVGDKDYNAILEEKTALEDTEKNAFMALCDGTAEGDAKGDLVKKVVEASKTFGFDASLMEASVKVLEKPKESRSAGFDETCMEQLKASFTTAISGLEVKLGEAEPAKQERASAVDAANTALENATKKKEELDAAEEAAKEAKASAGEAVKAAKKSLDDFLPELKEASEALDESKGYLQEFVEGALASFTLMKDLTEETFKEPEPPVAETTEEPAAEGEVEESPSKRAKTGETTE